MCWPAPVNVPARASELGKAIKRNEKEALRLIVQGAPLDVPNEQGAQPLLAACAAGSVELVRVLIGLKCDRNLMGIKRSKVYPLHRAAASGNEEIVALLLQGRVRERADLTISDANDENALHHAVRHNRVAPSLSPKPSLLFHTRGQVGVARLLIERARHLHPILFIEHMSEWTEMECQCCEEEEEFVVLNETPLHIAVLKGHDEMCGVLIEAGANVTRPRWDRGDESYNEHARPWAAPLHDAARLGSEVIARRLLAAGADVSQAVGPNSDTPLHHAATAGNTKLCTLLLDSGAQIDWPNKKKTTPVVCAVQCRKLETVFLLLSRGASLRVADIRLRTPVHVAADRCGGGSLSGDMMKAVLGGGGDVNVKDKWGQAPLHLAVLNGNHVGAQVLVENGADLEARDSQSHTPFLCVKQTPLPGSVATLWVLVKAGAQVDAGDNNGTSLLHRMCMSSCNYTDDGLTAALFQCSNLEVLHPQRHSNGLALAVNSGGPRQLRSPLMIKRLKNFAWHMLTHGAPVRPLQDEHIGYRW